MAILTRSLHKLQAAELTLCLWCNRRSTLTLRLLSAISRLGDGLIWMVFALVPLMLGFPGGWGIFGMMVCGTALNIATYSLIKRQTTRQRPFVTVPDITILQQPLDRYSFPSGHTLHAFFFATLMPSHVPGMGWILWPFAALIAASRVALGLHFPTDVLAGAVLGVLMGSAFLYF